MNKSHDQSYLDRKYFIDAAKYNCPFCNRKSVTYSVIDTFYFNWSNEKIVYGYLIKCGSDSCKKISLHLSDYKIKILYNIFLKVIINDEEMHIDETEKELDRLFFYHQPTTFFTLDNRINAEIKLVSEAEGCAKMNYLVGASGCLRKAIYELLEMEQAPKASVQGVHMGYSERIKVLKNKYPTVPSEYFDALTNIQGMTSEQLHEGGWKPWSQGEFIFLVETVKEVLTEIYVRPQEKSTVLQKILSLKPQKEVAKEVITMNKKIK